MSEKFYGNFGKGLKCVKNKQYDEAIQYFRRSIIDKKRVFECYYNQGVCYREKGDFPNAISINNKALEFNIESKDLYFNQGVCFYEIKEYEKRRSAEAPWLF